MIDSKPRVGSKIALLRSFTQSQRVEFFGRIITEGFRKQS